MEEQTLSYEEFKTLCNKIKTRTLFLDSLTQDEVYSIDDSLCEFTEELIFALDDCDIKYVISYIESKNNYSFFSSSVHDFLVSQGSDATICFDEEQVEKYELLNKLNSTLSYEEMYFPLALGEYYFNKDKEKSYAYYKSVFDNGLPFRHREYYYHLDRYLLLVSNPLEVVSDLLKRKYSFKNDRELYNLEYLYVQIKALKLMGKEHEYYLTFLKDVRAFAQQLAFEVEEERKERKTQNYDTDEERAHCELLSMLLEYFVFVKDVRLFYLYYRFLTDVIRCSGCTRYYHARDMYYYKMLERMKEDYPSLDFFDTIKSENLYLPSEENVDNLADKKIILTNESGKTFEFKVVFASDNQLTLSPIISVYGAYGEIIARIYQDEKGKYLRV